MKRDAFVWDDGPAPLEDVEQRPYTIYVCETVAHANWQIIEGNDVLVPEGGIVCDVATDDNDDSGYAGSSYASWRMAFRDRAAFDRVVGRSRRGVLSDVKVVLDGEEV